MFVLVLFSGYFLCFVCGVVDLVCASVFLDIFYVFVWCCGLQLCFCCACEPCLCLLCICYIVLQTVIVYIIVMLTV